MKITAINGSPRKEGRISRIVEEIIEGANENGHECETIYLVDLDIKDCTGCICLARIKGRVYFEMILRR